MTDILIQKLEEKVMLLLTDLEDLRKEVDLLRRENTTLKAEMGNSTGKLQGLLSLLDSLDDGVNEAAAPDLSFLNSSEVIV